MGAGLSKDTIFHWEYTDQPHADRRLEILKKHPEIKQYMKANGDPLVAVVAAFLIVLHILLAYVSYCIPDQYSYMRTMLCIFFGSFTASWLLMSMHEAGHGLIFGPARPRLNRLYGLLANLALLMPFFSYFKRHHKRHHKHLGDDELDCEYPTALEANLFSHSCLTKYFFMVYNPIFQHVRTLFTGDGRWDWLTIEEILNNLSCAFVQLLLFRYGYDYVWAYLALTTFMAVGFNLFGIWGMTVHCLFFFKEETLSYYGWMNVLMMNFGYHMEHHDFPNVPSRFLPQIRKIAPDFYEHHHQLDSLYAAALQWLHDPRLGLFSRLKRGNPVHSHSRKII